MSNPITPLHATPLGPLGKPSAAGGAAEGEDFAGMLRRQLEQVAHMQNEADAGVQKLLTGEAQNMTEVFVAAQKAQVAFSLLMEIRNKLADAYQEIQRLRV